MKIYVYFFFNYIINNKCNKIIIIIIRIISSFSLLLKLVFCKFK